MIMTTLVKFINKNDGGYDPITHTYKDTEVIEERTLNVTSMSYERAYRDYGVSNADMQVIRSYDDLPTFTEVEINGKRYVEFAKQVIGHKASLIVKEADK